MTDCALLGLLMVASLVLACAAPFVLAVVADLQRWRNRRRRERIK